LGFDLQIRQSGFGQFQILGLLRRLCLDLFYLFLGVMKVGLEV
jgi:hypothetical protein